MNLEELGYYPDLNKYLAEAELRDFIPGRVSAEHKERYIVRTEAGEYDAEITGNLRFSAQDREDFPAVGDWVALTILDDENAIIHKILPRFSMIKRQAVGQYGEIQIIAVNIDFAFLVQAADRDFNINRLERYLTICYTSKVQPIIILSKTDLIESNELTGLLERIRSRIEDVPVLAISNLSRSGYDEVQKLIEKGKTYCLLGSSGVGKSTLLNNLSGRVAMKTGEISETTRKGRHITTHRELTILENGGILIDNPGMREVGIADGEAGLEVTFSKIIELSQNCKFKDCTHTSETDCAVIAALENGEISSSSYENYLKMQREKAHFESNAAQRRKKYKKLAKIVKNYKKQIKKKR
jgi:ribosome biogenesis GTPase / thiamine phosphate phosphatase